ncbi:MULTISPECIES: thioredoxin family protein [Desulfosediminicola]|uniref:thioredoxin family protein n=1 Tax=Desulfosediminicola TaxID=2886823 RepID=UPI0010AB5268|nr:thioredoxin family protein [Desulfosediminicola ganghwensis]
MKITLYKSSLCPRCHFTRRVLEELTAERDDITIELVDVLVAPQRTIKDGVRMIPALVCGDHRLSGIWLGNDQIKQYIEQLTFSG